MKLKRIELGGRGFRLAPLTLGQVEDILDPDAPARERAWAPVLQSLANAGETISQQELEALLDLEDFRSLQGAVLDLSALRRNQNQAAAPEQNGEPFDFSFVRARLAAHCGWTPLLSDQQPFSEIVALLEYWGEVPPVDALFASFVGYKPKRPTRDLSESTHEDKVTLVHQWGGRIIHGRDNLPAFLQASLAQEGLIDFSQPTTLPT